jgi:iron(III) transport system ATP-binding protein
VANVNIRGLSKRFGGKSPTTAIDDLDLEIEPGEFLVLLGPSGCGKTTTLRCIAGLESAGEGQIEVAERTVFDTRSRINVPPDKRNIGMVFQSYALWPHMTVRKNIGYPLRARRIDRQVAKQWIDEVAGLVDCGNLLDRYPAQLSGGQQQRVALARGLVARPDVVLFDEPLSNLDARLRDQVRTEIHELHERLRFTGVYVTHDQVEALALGDRLAIMREGKLEQLGAPDVIFEKPATEYVAGFIGMGNRVALERSGGAWVHDGALVQGDLGPLDSLPGPVTARARPEDLELAPPDAEPPAGSLSFPVTVLDSSFAGRSMDVVVTAGTARLQSKMPAGERGSWIRTLELGQPLLGSFRLSDLTFFDQSQARIPLDRRPVEELTPAQG